jgi:hypothetical protein
MMETGHTSDMTIQNFRRATLLLAVSLLVAGCATSPEQLAKRDSDRCAARGLQPTTKAHDDCLTGLESQRDARTRARHKELVEQRAPTPYR